MDMILLERINIIMAMCLLGVYVFLFRIRREDSISSFFPTLSPALSEAYNSYKKGCQRIDFLFGIRVAIGTVLFYARCNIISGMSDGPYFQASGVCGMVAIISFCVFSFALALVQLLDYELSKRPNELLQAWTCYVRDRFCAGTAEEITVVCGAFAFGLSLYGRVAAGLCPEGASWLETAKCNPAAATHGLPMDVVFYLALYSVLVPVTVRAVRFEIAIITWFVGVGFLFASVMRVQAGMEGWMLILMMILCLTLTCENERFLRESFLNLVHEETRNKAVLTANAEVAEVERKRVEQEVVHEKELATREQAQLVALIGNVAHDLVSG